MPTRRTQFLPAFAVAGVACAFAFAGRAVSDPPATSPAAPDATPVVGPIAYYVANCARCHGDLSAAYNGLANPKTGKALEGVIAQMAEGPAQAPLDDDGLKQQTALHEAMFRKAPFVWLDPAVKTRVGGEVLPGTTLTFRPTSGPAVTPTVGDDDRFDLPRTPGTLLAKRGDQVVKVPVR